MARIRTIKPEFFTDEDLAELDPLDRLAFIGLWCHCDKAGRADDRPKRLKVLIQPFDAGDFEERLHRLDEKGFIIRYEVQGVKYIQVRTWNKHQRPHSTECESTIPLCNRLATVNQPLNNGCKTTGKERKGKEGKGKERKGVGRTRPPLTPPTVDEVKAYCRERNNGIDAEKFVDHHAARGWKLGRGLAMKDWKAAVRTWEKMEPLFSQQRDGKPDDHLAV